MSKKAANKERLLKKGKAEEKGKTMKKAIVAKYGGTHVTKMNKQKYGNTEPYTGKRKEQNVVKFWTQSKRGRNVQGGKFSSEKAVEDVSDGEIDFGLKDDTTAYSALLQSLQAKGGSFSDAYKQRLREEQGASSSDEDDVEELGEDGWDHATDDGDSENVAVAGAEMVQFQVDKLADTEEVLDLEDKEDAEESEDDTKSDDSQHDNTSKEDVNGARVASGGQAEACPDSFKIHLDRGMLNDEISSLEENKGKFNYKFAAVGLPGVNWLSNTSSSPLKVERTLTAYAVKKRLEESWEDSHRTSTWGDFESEQQCQFFSLCSNYQDILHTRKLACKVDGQSYQEDLSIMDAYVLHILNHIVKTRDLITKNNEKLHRSLNGISAEVSSDPPRDQGFTRPKVLVLLPFRSTALKFVDRLLKLAPSSHKANVEHKARFYDDFGVEEEDSTDLTNNVKTMEKADSKSGKPADFQALFKGNNDDHFRIGVKFTRKGVKLYSEFYSSDIIIASPVGLVTKIGEAEMEKEKDIDFLSSIEIAVVDFADVILMQNWSHVVSVFEHLNKIPTQQHGTDFMRIREWYLNDHARYYRQTIILSSFSDAGVNALFHRACVNHAGKVKTRSQFEGVLAKIVLQVRQVYERFDCTAITDVDDSRFEFFVKQVYPRLKNSLQGGTMLFTRSYFDFVRLRNFLKVENASFCLLGEYTKQSDVSRGRSWFFHGERKILLYTERAHFFHRYKIRGIKDLIFYSLPDHAHFYVELLNLMEGTEAPSCTVLFSRFDNLQLERIIGTTRAKRIRTSNSKLFMFC